MRHGSTWGLSMASKRLVKDIEGFRKLLVGRTVVSVQAGPSAGGGEHLHVKLADAAGKLVSVTISVGTVYGDLWYARGR